MNYMLTGGSASRRQIKFFRKAASDDQVDDILRRLKAIDYELMSIVTGGSSTGRTPLNANAGDALALIQRRLRALRIDMEVERGFDCAPSVPPHHRLQDRMPERTPVVHRPYRRRKSR